MKKFIIILSLFIVMLPSMVKAASITGTSIDGGSEVKENSFLSQSFSVNFSGISKKDRNYTGIYLVDFEIDYDENVLIPIDILSDGNVWNSELLVEKNTNKKYIVSTINDKSRSNKCADGELVCSNYKISMDFYVRKDFSSTTISMKNVEAVLVDIADPNILVEKLEELLADEEVSDEDVASIKELIPESSIHALTYNTTTTKNISITKSTQQSNGFLKPLTTVQATKPNIKDPNIISNITSKPSVAKPKVTKTTKMKDVYLKSLTIEGHDINFKKEEFIYDIFIKDQVKELVIKAEPEDSSGKVNIYNNKDIKVDDKVTIEVVDKEGRKNKYYIYVKPKIEEEEEKKKFHLDKKYIKLGIYVLGVLIVLFIIVRIIIAIRRRKLDKQLNKFL